MTSDEAKYYNFLTSKEITKIDHVKFITCNDNFTYSIRST